jgi:2-polyprenyl-3-methyl-5-hydroxy-6-metoxy-1,4-benzoquinol methylase
MNTALAMERTRTQVFAERMGSLMNEAALALMISIGHRTHLFDTMDEVGATTSEDLAQSAGLAERYVREWLGAMVTGGIVEYDPRKQEYRLPPEHAASLTRAAAPANLAVSAQWIPLLGSVEDRVVECFHQGGGVPYAAYPRFHTVMAEESEQTVLHALIDDILPLSKDLLARLYEGIDVLDVGCGRGRAIHLMARRFPRSRFTGCDFSSEAIAAARAEASRIGLPNAHFEVVDAARLDAERSYDLVTTFDAVHDQADPGAVLRNVHRSLRPGGVYLMQEIAGSSHVHENIDHPMGPFLYTVSCLHCMTVSLAAGGAGLGAMWGEQQARRLLADAGFAEAERNELPHDVMNHYWVATRR